MMAFDFPANELVAVEYVGLSQAGTFAETQKDVLRRALSILLPNAGEIVDVSEVPLHKPAQGIFVRCSQCDVKGDLSQFTLQLQEDDRFREQSNVNRSQFKLHITVTNQKTITWNVEIGARKIAWYPMFKTDTLALGGKLSKANFVALQCLEGVTCPQTELYLSQAECNEKIQRWLNRRINTAAIPTFAGKTALLSAEKIPFVPEVKAQSAVRASVVSKTSSLSIKTFAKALKNGGIGDVIPVEISATSNSSQKGKFVDARVIGEGEVEIVR